MIKVFDGHNDTLLRLLKKPTTDFFKMRRTYVLGKVIFFVQNQLFLLLNKNNKEMPTFFDKYTRNSPIYAKFGHNRFGENVCQIRSRLKYAPRQ